MTKGQLAMAAAIIYPEAQKLRRKGSSPFATERLKSERVSLARTVLRHTPDNAPLVLSGALGLDAAYEQALQTKENAEGEEYGMRKLRDEAPDLAD